jgi:DNA-binding XRE family transcriptional regulator
VAHNDDLEAIRARSKRLAAADREFRTKLVEHRRAAGLTQQDVATFLGAPLEEVVELERYDSDPLISELRRYSNAVGALVTHEVAADEPQEGTLRKVTTESSLRHSVYFFKRYRWMWLALVALTHIMLPLATFGFWGFLPWLSPPAALSIYIMSFGLHLTIFVGGRWELRTTPQGVVGVHEGLEARSKK